MSTDIDPHQPADEGHREDDDGWGNSHAARMAPGFSGLEAREYRPGSRPGAGYVRRVRDPKAEFRYVDEGLLEATPEADAARGALGKLLGGIKRVLIGRPVASEQESQERTGKLKGLAIFASDNISSSAYATEEIMRVLVLAGVGALALTMPLTLAIIVILAIVVISYRQVIFAYPNGGGSYVVAFQNLGTLPGLVAAASLLTDYVLTVAVSVSAGVEAITSAFPSAFEFRVVISVVLIALMTTVNLRGIRESGNVFTVPTYVYVVAMLGMLGYGFVRFFTTGLPEYHAPPEWLVQHGAGGALTLLLVLRAFASGSVALTGTEAVSNGVPAFKRPEVPNAQIVLVAMGSLFAAIFFGISFLSGHIGIVPDPSEVETVNSQLSRVLVGDGWFFYLIQFSTAVLLILAANTAFNGFPRLASILARDKFLPHQFEFRGDRLAFSTGIIALSLVSILLVIAFGGSVTALIPLYTIGVFVAFTLSQIGLVRHWFDLRQERNWQVRAGVNGLGAVATGIVAIVVAVSKFLLGAWIVLLLIPLLVGMMLAIGRHYNRVKGELEGDIPVTPAAIKHTIIVPVADLNRIAIQTLAYARSISPNVTALHIAQDEESARAFREKWLAWGDKVPLVTIESPYRSVVGPLLRYVDNIDRQDKDDTVTVILPEYVTAHWWEQLLHNQTALRIKAALLFRPGTVVTSVPYHAARHEGHQPAGVGEAK
jgi:amino acid transporter